MTSDDKKINKKWIIAGVVLAIVIVVVLFGESFIKQIAMNELKKQINPSSVTLYRISSENLDLNIFTGSISISGFSMLPTDSADYFLKKRMIKSLVKIEAESFRLNFLNLYKLIVDKKIDINKQTK